MKRRSIVLVALVAALLMASTAPVSAKTPLRGEMELYFNLGFGDTGTPCPGITWAGTIELDGATYGMTFTPTGAKDVGRVHHFWEDWNIYTSPFSFTGGVLTQCTSGDVVLAGRDNGITSPNDRYRMNGSVDQAAFPFGAWDGRSVHMSGVINWIEIPGPDGAPVVVPETAPGTFRMN